jgi:tetratricopeptide (TPR) repeat protein
MTRRKVMISSTALDLPEHREEIRQGCERAGFEPRVMEHLPAVDADATEGSLRMVEEADVYVGVFAYRYGYIPDGHETSITEMEYNRAVELNKPRLIFFAHKDHPIKIEDVETGPGEAKLKALKDRLGKERVVTFFHSPKDLRAQVVEALTALGKQFDTEKTGGAAASGAAKLHRTTSISAPPNPYIAHPYTLLQSRDLVGRRAELNALTDWVAKPSSRVFDARIFCFVAIGGMGKSALTWKWFNQIAPNEMKQLSGRIWWSFYESDATFENFLNRALNYVSGQSEDEVRTLPWQEREAQLLQHLDEKPYLFALDGLERVLVAYNRMDASSLADDEYDEKCANYVTGAIGLPTTAAQSFIGQHRLRQTTDPRAGTFLQKLTRINRSRVLISTRLYPWALQLPNGAPRPGCFAYFLPGLSDDDALALWRNLGVSGSRAELVPIFQSVAGHPLLVQALASEIANYRNAPRDFARWRRDHSQFDPTSLPLIQSRTHILEFALKGLSEKVHEILSMVVGFRMPATYATLEALLVGQGKACGSAQELDRILTELEDRGLVGWDREANRYDAHPIVRGVVWQLTNANDRQAIYTALEAHFEPMVAPDEGKVKTLADLTSAIEHYHTLVSLGRYDDACNLFHRRLSATTSYRLAAHRERIALLERLFPEGIANSPALTDNNNQAYALNELAHSYVLSGHPSQGPSLFSRAAEIYQQLDSQRNRQTVLSNLAGSFSDIGALRPAIAVLTQSLILNHQLKDRYREISCLWTFGRLLSLMGNRARASLALVRARQMAVTRAVPQSEGVATAVLSQHLVQVGEITSAASLADRAWALAAIHEVELDFVRAAILQGRAALGLSNLTQADERLHHALTRARAVNSVDWELSALIALA